MAKMKKELVLTNEEIDTLVKANFVLEKILRILDIEDDILLNGGAIEYPDILDEVYQNIENCFC